MEDGKINWVLILEMTPTEHPHHPEERCPTKMPTRSRAPPNIYDLEIYPLPLAPLSPFSPFKQLPLLLIVQNDQAPCPLHRNLMGPKSPKIGWKRRRKKERRSTEKEVKFPQTKSGPSIRD